MNDDELRAAYQAGLTIKEICAVYRVGPKRVREVVKDVERPRRDGRLKPL